MSKTIDTSDIEYQAEKSNIIYSESLQGRLPDDFIENRLKENKIVLSISERDYDLSLVSIKKTKKGNVCSFKAYNVDILDFIFSEKCKLNIYSNVYDTNLLRIKLAEETSEPFYILTVLIQDK